MKNILWWAFEIKEIGSQKRKATWLYNVEIFIQMVNGGVSLNKQLEIIIGGTHFITRDLNILRKFSRLDFHLPVHVR